MQQLRELVSSKLHGLAREEERVDGLAAVDFDKKLAILEERVRGGGGERGGSTAVGTGDAWGRSGLWRGGTPTRLPQVKDLVLLEERDCR